MPKAKTVAKNKRKLGRGMKALSESKIAQLIKMKSSGKYTLADLCAKFSISIPTIYNYWNKYQ
jgi:DNA invertase Pin-like site-specific DNA recombinase